MVLKNLNFIVDIIGNYDILNLNNYFKGILMKIIIYLQSKNFITLILVLFFSQYVFSDENEICETNICKTKLRLEISPSFRVGHEGKDTDGILLSSSFDIGKELSPRTTLSLRLLPVFGYIQEGNIDNLIGLGVGGALRIYFRHNQEKGFFTEIHEVILLHENKFEGNTSNINFYSSIGLGYQFCSHWDMLLKFGHISNANIKEENEGINILGLGIGYSF